MKQKHTILILSLFSLFYHPIFLAETIALQIVGKVPLLYGTTQFIQQNKIAVSVVMVVCVKYRRSKVNKLQGCRKGHACGVRREGGAAIGRKQDILSLFLNYLLHCYCNVCRELKNVTMQI